jgi:hypothetical protein
MLYLFSLLICFSLDVESATSSQVYKSLANRGVNAWFRKFKAVFESGMESEYFLSASDDGAQKLNMRLLFV